MNQPMAILGNPTFQKPRGGRVPQRHDCGSRGLLTREEIAKAAGITVPAVKCRLEAAWPAEALCDPPGRRHSHRRGTIRHRTMLVACQLARTFPDRIPTVQEVRRAYPMSKAAAVVWIRVMREAAETELMG